MTLIVYDDEGAEGTGWYSSSSSWQSLCVRRCRRMLERTLKTLPQCATGQAYAVRHLLVGYFRRWRDVRFCSVWMFMWVYRRNGI